MRPLSPVAPADGAATAATVPAIVPAAVPASTSARSAIGMPTLATATAVVPPPRTIANDGLLRQLLRVPLLSKLIVADLLINAAAYVVVNRAPADLTNEIVLVSLAVTLLLNAWLVFWALRPLAALELAAVRVSHGDLAARVPRMATADRNIERIGATLNALLDSVTADRLRVRQLASQVISAGDQERAHIARELHDSTAQSLSALEMLVTVSHREATDSALRERLGVMKGIVVEALGEVRTLSHNVHPRVLDDLGLAAALEFLARRTREQSGVRTRVTSDIRGAVPPPVASVLYRVAQEAVRNAVRHAAPEELRITLHADAREATLEVADEGPGFDVAAAEASRGGMGLFVMRERLALVDGRLEIDSRMVGNAATGPGHGTTVRATAPTASAAPAVPGTR